MGSTSDSNRKDSCTKFTPCELRAQSANTAKVILELGVEHTNDVFRVKAVRCYNLGVSASAMAVLFIAATWLPPPRLPNHWYFILFNETTGDEFVLEYCDGGIYFTLRDDDATVHRDVNPRGRLFGFLDGYYRTCFDRTRTGAEIAEYLNNHWSQSTYDVLCRNCQYFVRYVSEWWRDPAKVILELGVKHTNDVFRVKAVRYYNCNDIWAVDSKFTPLLHAHHWYFLLINETTGDEFVLEYDSGISFTLRDADAIVDRDVEPWGFYKYLYGYDKACFDQTRTGAEIAEYLNNNNWSQSTDDVLCRNCQHFVRDISAWWGVPHGDEQ